MNATGPKRAPDDSPDQCVTDHLHLARPIARAVRARVRGDRMELADLGASGAAGLLAAAARFAAPKGGRTVDDFLRALAA